MRSAVIAALAAFAGCADVVVEPEYSPVYVSQDVEYWREPAGPGSYEQCTATEEPHRCEYRLHLCTNGVFVVSFPAIVRYELYHLEADVAVTDAEGGREQLTFDLTTRSSTELGDGWIPITDAATLDCHPFGYGL
jgi:hypothetical protein